jgi:hypothetical protein
MTTGIRLAIRSSVERRRAAGAAAAQTRPGAAIAVRVDVRARRAVHDGGVAQDGGAAGRRGQAWLQGPPAHVPACLRLSASKSGHRCAHSSSGGRVLCAPSRGGAAAGGIGHVAVDPISGSCTLVMKSTFARSMCAVWATLDSLSRRLREASCRAKFPPTSTSSAGSGKQCLHPMPIQRQSRASAFAH